MIISCKQCELVLGEAAEPVDIVCPICVVLRYEIKREFELYKTETPNWAIGWVYSVDKADKECDKLCFAVELNFNPHWTAKLEL